MADQAKTVNIRVQQKTDDLSNWNSANPVLLDGELAVVRDGNNVTFRVGDGQRAFNDLSSAHSGKVDTNTLSVQRHTYSLRVQTRFLSVGSAGNTYSRPYGIVHGNYVSAMGNYQTVHGINALGRKLENFAFVWNGDSSGAVNRDLYHSHGAGTFNLNPVSGTAGLFIGERSLDEVLLDGTSKVYVGDAGGTQRCDLSVIRIGKDEYAELVAGDKALSNCLYIVSSDTVDAYGERVVNVADATDVSDAVNLGQLQTAVQGVRTPPFHFGMCESVGSLSAKTVSCDTLTSLSDGDTVFVAFTRQNSCSSFTLDVNGTGAHEAHLNSVQTRWYNNSIRSNSVIPFTFLSGAWTANIAQKGGVLVPGVVKVRNTVLTTDFDASNTDNAAPVVPSMGSVYRTLTSYVYPLSVQESAQYSAGDVVFKNGNTYQFDSDAKGSDWDKAAKSTSLGEAVNDAIARTRAISSAVDCRVKAYGLNTLTNDLSIDSTSNPSCVTVFRTDGFIEVVGENNGLMLRSGTYNEYDIGSGARFDDGWNQICANTKMNGRFMFQTLPDYLKNEYSPRYRLAHGSWLSVGNGLSCSVEDRTITTLEVSSQSVPLSIRLPNRPKGFARDFMIRFEISSSSAPTMTYTGDVSGLTFTSKPTNGVNVVSFLDTREV